MGVSVCEGTYDYINRHYVSCWCDDQHTDLHRCNDQSAVDDAIDSIPRSNNWRLNEQSPV